MRIMTWIAMTSVIFSLPLSAAAAQRPTGDDGIHIGAGSGRGTGRGSSQSEGDAVSVGAGRGVGRGVPVIGGVPIVVIDGAVQSGAASTPEAGRLGIASACQPLCSVKRALTGDYYYKYESFPRVVQVRQRSPADNAGIRVGDLIIDVDGRSILEEGAILNLDHRDRLRMTVRRGDELIDVLLMLP